MQTVSWYIGPLRFQTRISHDRLAEYSIRVWLVVDDLEEWLFRADSRQSGN